MGGYEMKLMKADIPMEAKEVMVIVDDKTIRTIMVEETMVTMEENDDMMAVYRFLGSLAGGRLGSQKTPQSFHLSLQTPRLPRKQCRASQPMAPCSCARATPQRDRQQPAYSSSTTCVKFG